MDWRERLAAYLGAKLTSAEAVTIARVGRMPAGASNETIALDVAVTCDGVETSLPLVLRPQRPDGILAPYDIGRQFTIMRALADTDVPVPTVAWHEPDAAILGVPFFLMHRLQCETPPLFWYGPGPRVDSAAQALGRVHRVDWTLLGFDSLVSAGTEAASPLRAELPQWDARARHTGMHEVRPVRKLREYLLDHEPGDARFALIHGDTNAGNYLFRGPDVVAIVDWELSAIGDPRSDLGFYAALNQMFGGYPAEPGESVLSEAYQRLTGVRLTNLAFYEAWGLYRMLIVMGGWGGRGWWGGGGIEYRLRDLLGSGWDA
jgi:aminoglycoside phosphotransferase (APT) family kinase protein